MSANVPKVSVLMTVYNGERHLAKAINSILDQVYKNIEFVIIDDGSTDDSLSIIKSYKNKQIRYITQQNQGLMKALNRGIAESSGEFIARMDQDDISHPDRLIKQVAFLQQNGNIAMTGTSFDLINLKGNIIGHSYHLDRSNDLRIEFLVRNPFGHGTMMIRRKVLEDVGGYDPEQIVEDYELWWRIASKYEVANLTECLYQWRISPRGMSQSGSAKRQEPIARLMGQIWSESKIRQISLAELREGFKHYEKLGPAYQEQYLYMVCAVTIGLSRMGYRRQALANRAKLLTIKGAARAFKDFRRDPFSHNYNLPLIKQG